MDAEESDKVYNFMAITGSDLDAARLYLEAVNWNMEEAVNFFMETGGDLPPKPTETAGSSRSAPSSSRTTRSSTNATALEGTEATSYGEEGVRAPDPSKRQRLVDDTGFGFPAVGGFGPPIHNSSLVRDPFRDFAAESQRLAAAAFGGIPAPRDGGQAGLASLFQPPLELLFHGTFQQARQAARDSRKYLLVNIQNDKEFASYMLNRDTWSNEVLQNLISSVFIFWQTYDTTDEGKRYCTLYNIQPIDLPHIGIIDPRTAERMAQWTGFADPEVMIERVTNFCSKHPMAAPQVLPSRQEPSIIDVSGDDDDLAAAIAASLDDSDRQKDSDELMGDSSPVRDPRAEETAIGQAEGAAVEEQKSEEDVPVPPEPEASNPDGMRIQLRLADGQRFVRRFLKSDLVSILFAFVRSQEAKHRPFELRTMFPTRVLNSNQESTLEDAQLSNAVVVMQWV